MAQAELDFDFIRQPGHANGAIYTRAVTLRGARERTSSASTTLLSVMDVARLLGCGRTFVYELIGAGQLETVKLGRLRRVPADALGGLVERLRAASARDGAHER